jgi:hypothetical protein
MAKRRPVPLKGKQAVMTNVRSAAARATPTIASKIAQKGGGGGGG